MSAARPSRQRTAVATACLAVCLVSLAGGAFAAGASGGAATDSDHVSVEVATDEEDHGDLLRFSVSLPDGGNATLAVEGAEYRRRVRVTDASGDGEVQLRVNTYLANRSASPSEVYAAAGEDAVTVLGNESANATVRFGTGTYTVAPEGDAGEESASVTVAAPGPWNATTFVAPAGRGDRLTDRPAIERARDAGWLTRSRKVALGDTLVLRVTAPGIDGALAAQTGPNETARFFAMQERSGTALYAIDRHTGPHEPHTILRLNETRSTTVVAAPRADTYYLVVATGAVRGVSAESRYGDVPDRELRDAEFVPRFEFDGEDRLNSDAHDSEGRHAEAFLIAERSATPTQRHADPVVVATRRNATVAGTTTLAPGSRVTVRLIRGPRNRTVAADTVRVSRERRDPVEDLHDPPAYRFRATFDLRNASLGGVDVAVGSNGTVLGTGQGEIVADGAAVELAGRDAQSPERVRVARAVLPAGGFLLVEADGRFLASTDRLDPGTHANVSVALGDLDAEKLAAATTLRAVVARDANGDGRYNVQYDRPYLDGPAVVNDTLDLRPATPTGTPGTRADTATTDTESGTTARSGATTVAGSGTTPRSGRPATATTAGAGSGQTPAGVPPPAGTTGNRNPTTTTTHEDGPGFGVGVALLALAVAAVGARGRRRQS